MGASRALGAVFLVLSVPVLLAGVLVRFSSTSVVPAFLGESTFLVLLGLGTSMLLLGILFVIGITRKKAVVAAAPAPETTAEVEIKRTEMNWGSQTKAAPSDELQDALDKVNQKIGRAKVQYGVGELSADSYKLLIADYEKEKAEIQRRILAQRE
jgi:heme/copper-type cytochrome/quinol oxidase subunit 2